MKMTIKMKLILSFMFVAILAATVGYIGSSNLNTMSGHYNDLWEQKATSFINIGNLETAYHQIRVNVLKLMLNTDPAAVETLKEKVNEHRATLKKNMDELLPKIESDAVKKLYEEFKQKTAIAAAGNNKVMELVLANKNKEAYDAYISDAEPKVQAAKDVLLVMQSKIIEEGNSENKDLVTESKTTINKMYSIISITVFLAVFLGWFIASGVTKSIFQAICEAKALAESIVNGKLDLRGDAGKVNFEFAGIVNGINDIINAFMKPLKVNAEYVNRISKGDMPPKITDEYKGDFNELKNNLNQCIDAVGALIKDANTLAEAAIAGKLSTRADASKHNGDFRKIVEGVNNTLDAVIGPLNVAAKYVDDISRGDIPEKIKESYNGDFNKIKDNLNQCVEAINELVKDANMLAEAAIEGRLDTRADAEKHKGDFKKIVEGVNNTLDAVLMPVNEARECLGEMAKGNFDTEMRGNYKGDHAILKNALNDTITSINEVLGQVKATVDQVNSGAGQVSMASQSLSQSSTEAASSLEEISASMQQISSQIKQNTENAVTANQVSNQAKSTAETGNLKMKDMVRAMGEINESAKNISKIIKAIDEIAFQTNLLALNAAVEAARAGKHGKGFTVVAEEVRNLAQRSAKAAKETAEMIEGAISKTDIGTKIADETAKVLEEIAIGSVKATDLMGEIAAASKEQTQGINQISQGLGQLDNVTQQNTATAEEAASASEELSSQSMQLKEMVEKFNLKNDKKTVNAYVSSHKVEKHEPKKITETKQSIAYKSKKIEKPHGSVKPEANPDKMITLDDNEFGKF